MLGTFCAMGKKTLILLYGEQPAAYLRELLCTNFTIDECKNTILHAIVSFAPDGLQVQRADPPGGTI